jgi:sugar phosphate isomerase/epimerase
MKATNLLHRAMRTVLYCRIATAIEMASKRGGHVAHHCVDCVPGGHRGDKERVVARWRSLVAFMKALDHLNREMRSVFHRRIAMAIEMARDGGAFVRCCRLFRLL